MRCYKITAKRGEDVAATRYAGTNALARATRDELMDAQDLRKKDVEIEQVEVPTAKDALLEFINELLAPLDHGTTEGDE